METRSRRNGRVIAPNIAGTTTDSSESPSINSWSTGSCLDYESKRTGKVNSPNIADLADSSDSQSNNSASSSMDCDQPSEFEKDGGLFEQIKQANIIEDVLDEWIAQYKHDKDSGLLIMMQFLIRASGCEGEITLQMYRTKSHAAIFKLLKEKDFPASPLYPIVQKGKEWVKFQKNFNSFFNKLVATCRNTIYDGLLMDELISFLIIMAASEVRPFRHTSTLAAMKLATALVKFALQLSNQLEKETRQSELERRKSDEHRSIDRLRILEVAMKRSEAYLADINAMVDRLHKGVNIDRLHDKFAPIRALCLAEIGIWMEQFPSQFFNDRHLKYLGWFMVDEFPGVRMQCLLSLQPLYAIAESANLRADLELFTNKFKNQVVLMALDKDTEVAVQAITLVTNIYKWDIEAISAEDCKNISGLVFSSTKTVAKAAGEFLAAYLSHLRLQDQEEEFADVRSLRELVRMYMDFKNGNAAYLVDSLIDCCGVIRDWESMTELLLQDQGSEQEQSSLIEIMACSVKQLTTGDLPKYRSGARKIIAARERRKMQEDQMRITQHLIPILPELIAKYELNNDITCNLLSIVDNLKVGMYITLRKEDELGSLLTVMQQVAERREDSRVLEYCARALAVLCNESHGLHVRCGLLRTTLLEKFSEDLRTLLSDDGIVVSKAVEPGLDDELYRLEYTLKKIAIFSRFHDPGPFEYWDRIFAYSKRMQEEDRVLPQMMEHCASACFYGLMNEMCQLENNSANESFTDQQRHRLSRRVKDFMAAALHVLIDYEESTLGAQMFMILCDLLVVFSEQTEDDPSVDLPVYKPDMFMYENILRFMETFVFSKTGTNGAEDDEEAKVAAARMRRNCAARYCNLFTSGALPFKLASVLFEHYPKPSGEGDIGDIIKETLDSLRKADVIHFARAMAVGLTDMFRTLPRDSNGRIDVSTEQFACIKDLAKKMALSFGTDLVKIRKAVYHLHGDGLEFATKKGGTGLIKNAGFLLILAQFSPKLMVQDKKVLRKSVGEYFGKQNVFEDDLPYIDNYRKSLA